MVAVRNSKKYEEFTRERIINYEGEYITFTDSDIEIWNMEPIWDDIVGVFNCRVDDVNNDIKILTSMSFEDFKRKYEKELDYGATVPISRIVA